METSETTKTGEGRWVRIFPQDGDGYGIYDVLREMELGCILFDADDNWIYDGDILTVGEQEDIAGFIPADIKKWMNCLIP